MQRTAFLAFVGVIVLLLAFTAHESRSSQKATDVAKVSPRVENIGGR